MIELLLVLGIFSALLMVAVPYWRELTEKNRALAYTSEIEAALRFTRSSAILLGESVTFCASKEHKECKGSWSDGQIVITQSGKVLRILSKIFNGDKLIWDGNLSNNQIVFMPTGLSKERRNGHFIYCPSSNSANAAMVIMSSIGRVRVSDLDAHGRRISCKF